METLAALPRNLAGCYQDFWQAVGPLSTEEGCQMGSWPNHVFIALELLMACVSFWALQGRKPLRFLAMLALCALAPFFLCAIRIFAPDKVYSMMTYSVAGTYLIGIVLMDSLPETLEKLKGQYSHILIDCQPSLGMLTVNALAAANRVIIPVQAEYLPAKGLEQLLQTINKVRRQINPKLQIDGILLTMVDSRTNFAKEISALLRETYGSKIKVFTSEIPHSVRAKEISAEGKSIYAHDPNGKVAEGYKNLTKEVLKLEKQREKNRAGLSR